MKRLVAAAWIVLLSGSLVGCDRFPYVVIENDTEHAVIATATDFDRDTKQISPGQTVNMSPLPRRQDTTYTLVLVSGEQIGCVTARFKGRNRTARVKVSEAVECVGAP